MFDKMGLDIHEVLEAAGTKCNFMKVVPGLVGGQCIGVNPYYLFHKSKMLGYTPKIINIAREINDGMASYIAGKVVKQLLKKGHTIKGAKVLVLGLTFKPNCPDVRNSKVKDLINELRDYECNVEIYDPWIEGKDALKEFGVSLAKASCIESLTDYSGVVLAVPHSQFNINDGHFSYSSTAFVDITKSL